jgi:hypothetical protein
VVGAAFDVDQAIKACPLTPYKSWRRGEKRWRSSNQLHEHSGAAFVISDASGDQVPVQVGDAIRFVKAHEAELRGLILSHGVEQAYLDFGWSFPYERTPGQWNFFPSDLLKLCVDVGLSICVSVYATSEDQESELPAAELAQQDVEDGS